MEINRKLAIKIWDMQFGKTVGAVDFAGRKIQKGAFGQLTSAFGWCLTCVLPKSAGGKSEPDNFICVHVKTAAEKEENFPSFNANDVKYKLTDESGRWEIIRSEDEDALAEQEEKRARALELWKLIFGDAETALDFAGRKIARDEYGSESEGAWKVAPYVDSKPTENKNAYIASLVSIEDALGKTAFRSNGKFFTLNKEMGVYSFNETELRPRPSPIAHTDEEPTFEFVSAETVTEPSVEVNEPISEEIPEEVTDTAIEDITETATAPAVEVSEPISEEAPEEVTDTANENVAETATQPAVEVNEPISEEIPEEVMDTAIENVAETTTEPAVEVNEPIAEDAPEEVTDTPIEDVAETATLPAIEVSEPISEEAPEEVTDTANENVAETATEPAVEVNEPISEEAPEEVTDTPIEDVAETATLPAIEVSEPISEEAPEEVTDTANENVAETATEPAVEVNEPISEEAPEEVMDTAIEDVAETATEPAIEVSEPTAEKNDTVSPSDLEASEPKDESNAPESDESDEDDESEAKKPDIFSPLYVSELIDRAVEEYSRPETDEAWLDFIVIHAKRADGAHKNASAALTDVVSSLITNAAGPFLAFDVSELTEENGAHNTVFTYRFVSPETADMERILNTAMLLNTYAALIIKKFGLESFKIYNYAGVFETARISYPSLTLAEYNADFKTFMTVAFGTEPFYAEEAPSTLYVSEAVSFNIPRLSEIRNDGTVYRTDARLTECNFVFGDLKERIDALNAPENG